MEMDLIGFYKLKSFLSKESEVKLKIASDSMHPTLQIGDLVTVRTCKPSDLNKFDIVVFWDGNRMISHFLWAEQQDRDGGNNIYITKSLKDPLGFDVPIKENLLLGKIDVKIPLITKLKILLLNFYK